MTINQLDEKSIKPRCDEGGSVGIPRVRDAQTKTPPQVKLQITTGGVFLSIKNRLNVRLAHQMRL